MRRVNRETTSRFEHAADALIGDESAAVVPAEAEEIDAVSAEDIAELTSDESEFLDAASVQETIDAELGERDDGPHVEQATMAAPEDVLSKIEDVTPAVGEAVEIAEVLDPEAVESTPAGSVPLPPRDPASEKVEGA